MTETAPKVTDATTPREMGAEMARLREQFGLSPHEVSERLHIRPRYISAMEEGRYEMMPGKAYARGYMHSYAEFLGMDADAVVATCFINELPVAIATPPSTRTVPSASLSSSPWRSYAVMAVGALVALVLFTQMGSLFGSSTARPEASVAPVPDAMLSSVRTLVMPTASNHECLTNDSVLGCFFADEATQDLSRLNRNARAQLGGDIDVSDMAVPLSEEPAVEAPTEQTDE